MTRMVMVMMLALGLSAATAAAQTGNSRRTSAAPQTTATAPVNLNTASATQLEALPGIGKAMAERIVEYRKAMTLPEQPKSMVVLGAGVMGLMNVIAAKQHGARVIVSEVDPDRLAMAGRMGADELIDATKVDPVARVRELTEGRGAEAVEGRHAAQRQVRRQVRGEENQLEAAGEEGERHEQVAAVTDCLA